MSGSMLIIGATSGIGRAVAHRLASERQPLVLAGRDMDELEVTATDLRIRYEVPVAVRPFEATDFGSHEEFFGRCLGAAPGGLGGVVLCHGFMADQKAAEADFSKVRAMAEVNFLSVASVLNVAADYFERRRRGVLCAVSSVAGERGRQSNYLYGCTKAALDVYLQGLRHRLFRSNVAVVNVKPGFVDTRMTWGLPGLFLVAQPERIAQALCRALSRKPSVTYSPGFWRYVMLAVRGLPDPLFHRTLM